MSESQEAPLHEKMAIKSGEAVQDLIRQHWPAIEAIALATGKRKASVSITIKFEKIGPESTKLVTSIRYAEKHSDEREDIVETEDPNQSKLRIE